MGGWFRGRGMRCLKILKYSLLVLLLLSSVYCYSLSPEEVEALKGLDNQKLIYIILKYDQAMDDLEIIMIERKSETEKREIELDLREKVLNVKEQEQKEKEMLLIQHEQMFLESLQMQRKLLTKTKFLWGIGGTLAGLVIGYPVGYFK